MTFDDLLVVWSKGKYTIRVPRKWFFTMREFILAYGINYFGADFDEACDSQYDEYEVITFPYDDSMGIDYMNDYMVMNFPKEWIKKND